MATSLLYYSPTSPYARKVRIAWREKGLSVEEVNPFEQQIDFTAANPLGKVPTLLVPGHAPLYDSTVILEALDVLAPTPTLLPSSPWERMAALGLQALADGMADVLIPAVYEQRRPAASQDAALIAKAHAKVRTCLTHLDGQLEGRPYALGGEFSLADVALLSALEYIALRAPELLNEHVAVQAYVAGHRARPSVAATAMPTNAPVR
jgi:glutathione S-transferase